MKDTKKLLGILNIITAVLLLAATVCGVLSFSTAHTFETVNQYGDTVKMWGYGIYKHDSFFKAPLYIGTDLTILALVLPLSAAAFVKARRQPSLENHIECFGNLAILLYYGASLSFSITYNKLHLVYIALFSVCLFSLCMLMGKFHTAAASQQKVCSFKVTNGIKVFLILSGISLFVAWLPDIITSLAKGRSLELIEVYTTEVTYVLDMGIISPLMFIAFFLVRKDSFIGYVLLRMILKVGKYIGIILPVQTVFQLLAGIDLPVPALITKVGIFVALAAFAAYFERKIKKDTQYISQPQV